MERCVLGLRTARNPLPGRNRPRGRHFHTLDKDRSNSTELSLRNSHFCKKNKVLRDKSDGRRRRAAGRETAEPGRWPACGRSHYALVDLIAGANALKRRRSVQLGLISYAAGQAPTEETILVTRRAPAQGCAIECVRTCRSIAYTLEGPPKGAVQAATGLPRDHMPHGAAPHFDLRRTLAAHRDGRSAGIPRAGAPPASRASVHQDPKARIVRMGRHSAQMSEAPRIAAARTVLPTDRTTWH